MKHSTTQKTKGPYSLGEFAQLVGKSTGTLQRWDRERTLVALRTPTGRRFYTHEQYLFVTGQTKVASAQRVLVYARAAQAGRGPLLDAQVQALQQFCSEQSLVADRIITDVGSALSPHRPGFEALIEAIATGSVSTLLVATSDRLLRSGTEWFKTFCGCHGTEILDAGLDEFSTQRELEADFLTATEDFYGRLHHRRELLHAPTLAPSVSK